MYTLRGRNKVSTQNSGALVLSLSLFLPSFFPSSPLLSLFTSLCLILSEQRDDTFYIKGKPRRKQLCLVGPLPPQRHPTNPMKLLLTTSSFPRVGPRISPDSFQHHLVLLYDGTIHSPSFRFYLCHSCPKFFPIFSTLSILYPNISSKYHPLLCEIISNLPYLRPTLCHPKASIIPILDTLHSELQPFIYIFIFPTSTPQDSWWRQRGVTLSFFKVWYTWHKIYCLHHFLSIQLSSDKYIYIVPPSCKTETLYPINNISSNSLLPPAPGTHLPFCLYEFDYSRYLI